MKRENILRVFFIVLIGMHAASIIAQDNGNKKLNYNVFCFYYNWYGNPQYNGKYIHWAHPVLKSGAADHTTSGYIPGGDDIAANYYPVLGAYSSTDPSVIRAHMRMIRKSGIGNIVLTWWAKNDFNDQSVKLIMDEAALNKINICFHIEPFSGRDEQSTREAIEYLIDTYGSHPAFYRSAENGNKPFIFIYDSYLTKAASWASLLKPNGRISIRNSKYDAVIIGLWLSDADESFFSDSGFDGFYTYFASTGFTAGSTPSNWKKMQKWAVENDKIFIPCVGPGYIDTRVRPWNEANTRDRKSGSYYDHMFAKAIESNAPYIGITSFNEWHEGTQIEPALPFSSNAFHYMDYGPMAHDFYLKRTKYWLDHFKKKRK